VLTVIPATLPDAELERRLAATDAAAILKVGRHLPRLKTLLARLNLESLSVYVSHATRPDERVLPLGKAPDGEAPYFSMLLVAKGGAA
nr:precorrin-2 C(20)-methyltransferase [Hyphomicrobiales bacterium]